LSLIFPATFNAVYQINFRRSPDKGAAFFLISTRKILKNGIYWTKFSENRTVKTQDKSTPNFNEQLP